MEVGGVTTWADALHTFQKSQETQLGNTVVDLRNSGIEKGQNSRGVGRRWGEKNHGCWKAAGEEKKYGMN